MAPRIWLITGCTSGFGMELVRVVHDHGDIAVATARDPKKLEGLFPKANDKNYLALRLDAVDRKSIDEAINETKSKFGRIDVLVNNAGYGLSGVFESYTDEQIRRQMEVNFFGLVDITRAGMEVMREQKPQGGVIQQVTSIGGMIGVPGSSIYCASKWAVEGFTEAISKEVKPEWGIKFTNIEPGPFRTNWANGARSMFFGEKETPQYDHFSAKEKMDQMNGNQSGDPFKAAQAMYQLAVMKEPPIRCVLGGPAQDLMSGKVDEYRKNTDRFETLARSADYDQK